MKFLGTDITRNIETELLGYLPKEYEDYKESLAIIQSEAKEFELLNDTITDIFNQLFIDTATWGLSEWERMVGIKTDDSIPFEERRSTIKSKIRGYSTINVDAIKSIINASEYGDINITENSAQYTIEIDFTSEDGLPSNIESIEKLLNELMPAHLLTKLFAKYNWHKALSKKTHSELSIYSHESIRTNKSLRTDYKR